MSKMRQKAVRWPCGVCSKGVGSNSLQCTSCQKWVHKKCSGIKGRVTEKCWLTDDTCEWQGCSCDWWNFRHLNHHSKPNILTMDPDVTFDPLFLVGQSLATEVRCCFVCSEPSSSFIDSVVLRTVELQDSRAWLSSLERNVKLDHTAVCRMCLQCFDTVGWAAGRASGL